jgi:hypothetical protein
MIGQQMPITADRRRTTRHRSGTVDLDGFHAVDSTSSSAFGQYDGRLPVQNLVPEETATKPIDEHGQAGERR